MSGEIGIKKETGTIVSQEKLQDGIYSLWVRCDAAKSARAGQFVSLYLHDRTKILPRPISICEIERDKSMLRFVYRVSGEGTRELSTYTAGERIALLGALGNGYRTATGDWLGLSEKIACRVILVGGGIGIPPMVETARQLRQDFSDSNAEMEILSVMGYRDANLFLTDELRENSILSIATEDGSVGAKGNVVDVLRELYAEGCGDNQARGFADVIYACGPKPMLSALKEFADDAGVPLYVSLEERMACGIGACLACVCETKETDAHTNVKNARVCKDGPVFNARDIVL